MIEIWSLQGTDNQNAIVRDALRRCDFPFELLVPKLQSTKGKSQIPVEWADLSRYAAKLAEAKAKGGHLHVHEDGDTGHPIERRERVLGLAWYSGKVTLDTSLESEPELAKEVFLAEGAHMVDFFYMTNEQRIAVWNSIHPEHEHLPSGTNIVDDVDLGHGHGWFDIDSYYEWVGEEFMGLFVKSFSDVQVSIGFTHIWDSNAKEQIRKALLPPAPEKPKEPVEEPVKEPDEVVPSPYFSRQGSKIYHDLHKGVSKDIGWPTAAAARAAGLRPCGVCKP